MSKEYHDDGPSETSGAPAVPSRVTVITDVAESYCITGPLPSTSSKWHVTDGSNGHGWVVSAEAAGTLTTVPPARQARTSNARARVKIATVSPGSRGWLRQSATAPNRSSPAGSPVGSWHRRP